MVDFEIDASDESAGRLICFLRDVNGSQSHCGANEAVPQNVKLFEHFALNGISILHISQLVLPGRFLI